jgi:hypothetical protein
VIWVLPLPSFLRGWLEGCTFRRAVSRGALLGFSIYTVLLVIHLVKFGGIYHAVPNIAGYAGRYPGYGFTWDLDLINVPADLLRPRPATVREARDPKGWVTSQTLTHYSNHPKVLARDPRGWADTKRPRAWNPWTWLATGVLGYTFVGLGAGAAVFGVHRMGGWLRSSMAR